MQDPLTVEPEPQLHNPAEKERVREEEAFVESRPFTATPLENDVFTGVRLGLNDEQSTQLLAGAVVDFDSGATAAFVEASRRLGNSLAWYF